MKRIVSHYLKYLRLSVSKTCCETLITSHPDCPSMLCVADTLERLDIDHRIARVNRTELRQLPFPYVLHFDKHGGELARTKALIKDWYETMELTTFMSQYPMKKSQRSNH